MILEDYTRKLGEVLKTKDIKKLKDFCKKMDMEYPNDNVLKITMHKMICNRVDFDDDFKKESEKWLRKRGFSVSID